MKAIQIDQYGGEDQLKVVEVAQPKAKKGQVLVRVLATSFNPIDLKLSSGNMRQIMPLQFPFVPGADFSGVVDSVAADVKEFKPGDEVFGYSHSGGAYAEYIAIDADKVAPKPKKLNHIEAASLALVGQTALQMVEQANVEKLQTVLVQGAGGAVGGVAVQIAHHHGAKVIGTASGTSIDRVKQYGAVQVIDFKTTPFEKAVHGVDAVLDAVGGDVEQRSFEVLRTGGVLVSIVQPPSKEEAAKYHVNASMLVTQSNAESLRKVAQLADTGVVKPFVGKVYPLTEVAKGWRDYTSNHVDGKIVFTVGAEARRSATGD
jgi:NADPH:quinone reductase-like Zn-dependent oxidoreductase